MKTLPLTVLVHEGPQARAYLSRLRLAGWQPERIVLMVQKRHPATGKPVGRWLPEVLRMAFAEKTQDLAENYWPRQIQRSHPWLLERVVDQLDRITDKASDTLEEMLAPLRYENYAETVDRVLVDNLRDPALERALVVGPSPVLFTGGGILRNNLLDLPGINFLHVHPGTLPHVRGADCLLWSVLVRGCPGFSCFYMADGIDTGAVICARDYPPFSVDISGPKRPEDQLLYRALMSFCDPILRAHLLISHVLGEGDLTTLPAVTQNHSDGLTYHFLHPEMRRVALARVFRS